jgi:hypothetical protein
MSAISLPPRTADSYAACDTFRATHEDWPAWLGLNGLSRVYLKNFWQEDTGREVFDGWLSLVQAAAQAFPAQLVAGVSGHHNEALNVLAQSRRAVDQGVRTLAVWNYNQMVRDAGSQDLFLSALDRTVLTQGAAPPRLAMDAPTSAPIRMPIVMRSEPVLPPDDSLLPPPPDAPDIPSVPNEEGLTPDAIETARGNLIDIQGELAWPVDRPRPEGDAAQPADPNLDAALAALAGRKGPGTVEGDGGAGMASPVLTRRQLLDELLSDPLMRQEQRMMMLWRNDESDRLLRLKFANIFD